MISVTGIVGQQRFERPEPEHHVDEPVGQPLLLALGDARPGSVLTPDGTRFSTRCGRGWAVRP